MIAAPTKWRSKKWMWLVPAKRYALFVWPKNGAPLLLREKLNNKKDRDMAWAIC